MKKPKPVWFLVNHGLLMCMYETRREAVREAHLANCPTDIGLRVVKYVPAPAPKRKRKRK